VTIGVLIVVIQTDSTLGIAMESKSRFERYPQQNYSL